MAYYAWSPIVLNDEKTVPVGDAVTADKLGISKDEFQVLADAGAVRETKYPKDIGEFESPAEYNLRKLNEKIKQAEEEGYGAVDLGGSSEGDESS